MQTLSIEKRDNTKAASLRKSGRVPVAIQGKGVETVLGSADAIQARRVLADSHGQKMMVAFGGESAYEVLVRGMDFDAAKGQLLNLSLQRVSEDDVVTMDVPVVADGEPASVTDGQSTLSFPTATVQLKGALHDLPEEIHVDVSKLEGHDKLLASDLVLPNGVTLATSPDAVVATTSINRAFMEASTEEATASADTALAPDAETAA